jgi:hypothetical protein
LIPEETDGDSYFEGDTPDNAIEWARSAGCLDELLTLKDRNMSLREFFSIRGVPVSSGDPFPTVRRVGGDRDRGFSRALNDVLARRARTD